MIAVFDAELPCILASKKSRPALPRRLSARFHVNSIIQIVRQLSPYAGLKVRSLKEKGSGYGNTSGKDSDPQRADTPVQHKTQTAESFWEQFLMKATIKKRLEHTRSL